MKAPSELPTEAMRAIISDIQMLLWLEMGPESDSWNADKQWDSETLEYVASVLEEHGLRPDKSDLDAILVRRKRDTGEKETVLGAAVRGTGIRSR